MTESMKSNEIGIQQFSFVEVDPFQKAPFCVDGRAGKVYGEVYGAYPQMLGGSLMPVVLEWLMKNSKDNLPQVLADTFLKLKNFGYPLGVHTSTHAVEGKSDCGFADNLGKILETFRDKSMEIREILDKAGVNFENNIWQRVNEILNQINLEKISRGEDLVRKAKDEGGLKQTLDGQHQEIAAIVNWSKNTTLDVDNNQQNQAFNLDLWLVEEIAEKMGWDNNLTVALSLGLYAATEMVLVEEKGKPRLSILIKND